MKCFRLENPKSNEDLLKKLLAEEDYFIGISRRIVRRYEDAVEIVHDSFMVAYEKYNNFCHKSGYKTWATRIVINKSLDFYRRFKRRKLIITKIEFEKVWYDDTLREEETLSQYANSLLAKLSPRDEEFLRLRFFKGLKIDKIGEQMGVSATYAGLQIKGAIKKIRQNI